MLKLSWFGRLAGIGLSIAICTASTAALADDEDDADDSGSSNDDSRGVPELDPRAAGLALTVLGGAMLALNGRRKRSQASV